MVVLGHACSHTSKWSINYKFVFLPKVKWTALVEQPAMPWLYCTLCIHWTIHLIKTFLFLQAKLTLETVGLHSIHGKAGVKTVISGTKSKQYLTCSSNGNGKFYAVVSCFLVMCMRVVKFESQLTWNIAMVFNSNSDFSSQITIIFIMLFAWYLIDKKVSNSKDSSWSRSMWNSNGF
jgi:hypothetical protein